MRNIRAFQGVSPVLGEGTYVDEAATVIGVTKTSTRLTQWLSARFIVSCRGEIRRMTVLTESECRESFPSQSTENITPSRARSQRSPQHPPRSRRRFGRPPGGRTGSIL